MQALAQAQDFPKVNFTFTAEQTRDFLYAYTPQEVALHRWMTMHIALAMPISLAAFAVTMIHHSLGRGRFEFLVAMAVWGSVADYSENMVIISLLDGGGTYELKAALTIIKLALVVPPQTVALYLFLKYVKTRLLAA